MWTVETAEDYGITEDSWLKMYFNYDKEKKIFTDVTCCINDFSKFDYRYDTMIWQINTILGFDSWKLDDEWYDIANITNEKAMSTQLDIIDKLSSFITNSLDNEESNVEETESSVKEETEQKLE